jgi:hypothetical protein
MSLSVFQRLAGTLLDHFRIGRVGPTIRQGTGNPNTTLQTGNAGDMYVRHGAIPGLYQRVDGTWVEVGNQIRRQVVVTQVFNATNDHNYLGVNRNGSVEIYLPPGSASKTFTIKDEGGFCTNLKTITIFPAVGDTIDGESSYVIESPRSAITVVYGSAWHII